MELSKEKIELLKKALPELYELIINITSLLEEDLKYVKNISKDEIDKINNKDPDLLDVDLKLAHIQKRANVIRAKLKKSIKNCETSLEIKSNASLTDVLSSKEVCENLSFNEKFIASAVATAISKIKI